MKRWFVLAVACAAVACVTLLWFGSSGSGEYRNSPDGRFTAHVSNLSRGTLLDGRVHYIEVRVVEVLGSRLVWRFEYRYSAGAAVPNYGDRAQQFITWTANSSSLTIPLVSGHQITIPMP